MATLGTKSLNLQTVSIPSFPYGVDWSNPPEALPQGALVEAENAEYSYSNGALKTVDGIEIKYTGSDTIQTGFYDTVHSVHLFNIGTTLYKTDFSTTSSIGTLNGSSRPHYVIFNNQVIIASGGIIQAFGVTDGRDATVLQNVCDADDTSITGPTADALGVKDGRLFVYSHSSDLIKFSAYGDETSWVEQSTVATGPYWVYIGKNDGYINQVSMASKDLIIYKDSGVVYRLTGWIAATSADAPTINEVTRTGHCYTNCATSIATKGYFFGIDGFLSVVTTQEYGDMKPTEEGININAAIIPNIDSNAKMFHVASRKQIWIATQNDKRVYMYHYSPRYPDGRGAFTTRTLKYQISDVWENGDKVYVAYGDYIGQLSSTIDTDAGKQIKMSVKGPINYPNNSNFLVKRRRMTAKGSVAGTGTLLIGDTSIAFTISDASPLVFGNTTLVYGNTDLVYSNSQTVISEKGGGLSESIQLSIVTNSGSMEIRQISYNYEDQ